MKMTFRWYGSDRDPIPLEYIKQIPGLTGLVWALFDIPAGEVWPLNRMEALKKELAPYNLSMDVVESLNVHEDIKLGTAKRDALIENYILSLRHLARMGVRVVCYNFMPVFDWTRTELFKKTEDGSTALFFEKAVFKSLSPTQLVEKICSENEGMTMAGWEKERLDRLEKTLKEYEGLTSEDLFAHLVYFLKKICPVAEELGIGMALHPDDPPWSIYGLPRIVNNAENFRQLFQEVPSPANGLTLCSGSLGAREDNDIPAMIREWRERIFFAHIRNVKRFANGDFIETSHRSQDGSVPIVEILKAYDEIGFTGYVRPDHGRHIWGEKCIPGYGLYDRAMGAMYLQGIWDTLQNKRGKDDCVK